MKKAQVLYLKKLLTLLSNHKHVERWILTQNRSYGITRSSDENKYIIVIFIEVKEFRGLH